MHIVNIDYLIIVTTSGMPANVHSYCKYYCCAYISTVAQKTAPMFHCFGKMDLLSNAVTSKKSEKIM
jgi:hypothetical protein